MLSKPSLRSERDASTQNTPIGCTFSRLLRHENRQKVNPVSREICFCNMAHRLKALSQSGLYQDCSESNLRFRLTNVVPGKNKLEHNGIKIMGNLSKSKIVLQFSIFLGKPALIHVNYVLALGYSVHTVSMRIITRAHRFCFFSVFQPYRPAYTRFSAVCGYYRSVV